jgi:hypothetical protein
LEVHHRDLLGRGRTSIVNDTLDNLLTLCRSCHCRLHSDEYSQFDSVRNTEIYNLRCSGITFAEIANQFHITRQRAHQIYISASDYLSLKKYRP